MILARVWRHDLLSLEKDILSVPYGLKFAKVFGRFTVNGFTKCFRVLGVDDISSFYSQNSRAPAIIEVQPIFCNRRHSFLLLCTHMIYNAWTGIGDLDESSSSFSVGEQCCRNKYLLNHFRHLYEFAIQLQPQILYFPFRFYLCWTVNPSDTFCHTIISLMAEMAWRPLSKITHKMSTDLQ